MNNGEYGTDLAYFVDIPVHRRDKSAFGELTYTLGHWSATAGFRYSDTVRRFKVNGDGALTGGPFTSNQGSSERSSTPKYLIKYQPNADLNYYAVASKGFRQGGPNSPLPDSCQADLDALGLTREEVSSYKSDMVWNYELGVKARLLDRRLSANASVFRIDWTGIKQLVKLPICGFQFNGNGGAARSKGAELELSALLTEGFTASAAVGYTDAKVTKASDTAPAPAGSPIQQVSPWTVSLAADYQHALGTGLIGFGRLDYSYADNSHSAANDAAHPRLRRAYSIVGARAGVIRGPYEVALFVKNATNARPNLSDNVSQGAELEGRPRILTLQPRSIGVDFRFRF